MNVRLCCWIVTVVGALSAYADDSVEATKPLRPVTAAYTIEAGSSHLVDTYLTPLKYTGWTVALGYERMQAMRFNPELWVMQMKFRLAVDRGLNPARNATMWNGGIDFSWGMMRRWRNLYPNLTIGVGGVAQLNAGCLYNTRNGNNPAAARAALTVDVTAYGAWNTHIGKLPITLRYQPTLPILGAFFSPDYGELYYEIYLGNHGGLAHCAWWGNYFAMENFITADLHFGATTLRLGYRNNILSTHVNDITSRQIGHCAVVGVAGEWVSLTPSGGISPATRKISALY
jgi:hypothetical protein